MDAANVLLPVRAGEPKPVAIGQGMLEAQIRQALIHRNSAGSTNFPVPRVPKIFVKNLRYQSTWGVEFVSESCNLVGKRF